MEADGLLSAALQLASRFARKRTLPLPLLGPLPPPLLPPPPPMDTPSFKTLIFHKKTKLPQPLPPHGNPLLQTLPPNNLLLTGILRMLKSGNLSSIGYKNVINRIVAELL